MRAVAAHNACRKELARCEDARRLYEQFFARYPDSEIAADMKFFFAELLYDHVHDYNEAARWYADVATHHPGKWQALAAYDFVLSLRAADRDSEIVSACDGFVLNFLDDVRAVDLAFDAAE